MTYSRLYLCVGALVLAGTGCGLISSDVTNFDLTLPDKNFSVDASGWNVNQTAADLYLGQTCTGPSDPVCSSAVANACAMGCTGVCGSTNHCELQFQVAAHQGVDLVTEKPELKTINDEPVIKVTIDSVQYEVTKNSLNVDTPEIGVYVAPMSVMNPTDPMAKQVGKVAPIPAMTTFGLMDLTYTDIGKQNLIDTMSTYKNPFNVLVGTTITIKMGDMVPSGKLDAVIHIKAHAGL